MNTPDMKTGPAGKYLDGFNKMFSLFETCYDQNMGLLTECKEMNQQLLENAKQVQEILQKCDGGKTSIGELHKEYQEVTKKMKEARAIEITSKQIIHNLRKDLESLKSSVGEEESDEEEMKLRKAVKDDISVVKSEKDENANEILRVEGQIRKVKDDIAKVEEQIKLQQSDFDTVTGFDISYTERGSRIKQSNAEMEQLIEDTERDIKRMEEETVELARITEEKKVGNRQLEKDYVQSQIDLKSLENEKSRIYGQTQTDIKTLKKNQKEIEARSSQHHELSKEFAKRKDQHTHLSEVLSNINREISIETPQLKEIATRHEHVTDAKNALKDKAAVLRVDVYNKGMQFTLNENEKQSKIRIVQAQKYDLIQTQKAMREEESKTHAVIGQEETMTFQTITTKKKMQEMKEIMTKVTDDIERKDTELKMMKSNIFLLNSDRDHFNAKNEEANQVLNQMKEKNAHQTTLIEKLREERNSFRRQWEKARKEHDELHSQYSMLIRSIEQMTDKIDSLAKECTEIHFRTAAHKSAMESMSGMKTKCEEGIKVTNRVITSLIAEMQTMNRILTQSEHDKSAQARELMILKENKQMILLQLVKKSDLIEQTKSDIMTADSLLKYRAKQFKELMNTIHILNDELNRRMRHCNHLEKGREHVEELQFNARRLRELLQIEHARSMALTYDSAKRRNIHRWIEIEATDPERAREIRYFRSLSGKMLAADQQLEKLRKVRDKLKKRADVLQARADAALPMEAVLRYMQRYREDLEYKEAMMDAMEKMINDHRNKQDTTRKTCRSVRAKLSRRREATCQMRTTNTDIIRNEEESAFITEQTVYTEPPASSRKSRGGGFKPRPPAAPRDDACVPRLNLYLAENRDVGPERAPKSQRYQRPNIGQIRKRLALPMTRPVTARK